MSPQAAQMHPEGWFSTTTIAFLFILYLSTINGSCIIFHPGSRNPQKKTGIVSAPFASGRGALDQQLSKLRQLLFLQLLTVGSEIPKSIFEKFEGFGWLGVGPIPSPPKQNVGLYWQRWCCWKSFAGLSWFQPTSSRYCHVCNNRNHLRNFDQI